MGQEDSLRAQLVTQIVDRPKTIRALSATRDVMTCAVASTEFNRNTLWLLGKGNAQIEATIPEFGAGFQFLPRIAMKSWRRRHSTKECVDHHGRCSFMIRKSGQPSNFPTIESKFSRMRKTGVKNP
jgi:hypothetical protein